MQSTVVKWAGGLTFPAKGGLGKIRGVTSGHVPYLDRQIEMGRFPIEILLFLIRSFIHLFGFA